jgi:hypothetical protein
VITYYPFKPSQVAAPRFQAVIDGVLTTVVVTWNVAAQRYYINVYTSTGALVVARAVVETARARPLNVFYYDNTQRAMIGILANPVWRPVGQIVNYTFEGFQPESLNHAQLVIRYGYHTGMFAYRINTNPGEVTVLGSVSRYANMLEGYANQTSLIFRNNQFEVNDSNGIAQPQAS